MRIKLTNLKCTRCGYTWYPKKEVMPKRCASKTCKSPYWDRPKGPLGVMKPLTMILVYIALMTFGGCHGVTTAVDRLTGNDTKPNTSQYPWLYPQPRVIATLEFCQANPDLCDIWTPDWKTYYGVK